MGFYKTNHESVLNAVKAFHAAKSELFDEAKKFSEKYGGKEVVLHDGISINFAGLKFDPPKNKELWTIANYKNHFVQSPRKVTQNKELYKQYHADFPSKRVTLNEFYKALGTDWGNVIFNGLGWFEGADGYIYVDYDLKLADHMIEILGSEYEEAKP